MDSKNLSDSGGTSAAAVTGSPEHVRLPSRKASAGLTGTTTTDDDAGGSYVSPSRRALQVPPFDPLPRLPSTTWRQNQTPWDLSSLRALADGLTAARPKKRELSSECRIAIVTAVACGLSRAAVADTFRISNHTVRQAIDRWTSRRSVASRPRSGRPPKLSTREEQGIVAAKAGDGEASTNAALADTYGVCKGTIRRVLKKHRAQAADAAAAARAAAAAAGEGSSSAAGEGLGR